MLAIGLLLVFTVVAGDVEVVILEAVLTLVKKLNGDILVAGVVLKPVNDPNALFVGLS